MALCDRVGAGRSTAPLSGRAPPFHKPHFMDNTGKGAIALFTFVARFQSYGYTAFLCTITLKLYANAAPIDCAQIVDFARDLSWADY